MQERNDDDEVLAGSVLIQAIENQIESGDPPVTRATLNKLTLVGYPREEILDLMTLVLSHEIQTMLADNRPFDRDHYETLMRALPDLPEEPA
jgi:hypothetical protein